VILSPHQASSDFRFRAVRLPNDDTEEVKRAELAFILEALRDLAEEVGFQVVQPYEISHANLCGLKTTSAAPAALSDKELCRTTVAADGG
jgi:hypothetical protein